MPRSSYFAGAYTVAKLDFLSAARATEGEEHHPVGVNRRWCRQLQPYGQRMVNDGLMTLHRDGGLGKARHTFLCITDKGLEELERLEKKMAARERKFGERSEIADTRNFHPMPS
jgi:hypothetical protein